MNGLAHFALKISLILSLWIGSNQRLEAQNFPSYKGLVMAGYQAWFGTPGDGHNTNWKHYCGPSGKFEPGLCSIDFWPDTREYEKTYATAFQHKDGSVAKVYSSIDASSVDLHFSWMKQYGIDGVFLQRFASSIRDTKTRYHCDKSLKLVSQSANKHQRAYALMYDLSGLQANGEQLIMDDVQSLEDQYHFTQNQQENYLYHKGKALIAVWGVGFSDNRPYGLEECEKIIDHLKSMGYSIMLGVPTFWRELKNDAIPDPRLHRLIQKCDLVMPWFVGRYNSKNFAPTFTHLIEKDVAWCQAHHIDYVPLIYPGFSWSNMKGKSVYIPREGGDFLWAQGIHSIQSGAEQLYVAMFDEVDEGTAIFKTLQEDKVPDNAHQFFRGIEPHLPSDHYLWLTGQLSYALKGQIDATDKQPERKLTDLNSL